MVNNEVEGGQGPAGVFVQCYAGIKKRKRNKTITLCCSAKFLQKTWSHLISSGSETEREKPDVSLVVVVF